ncbi:Zn-ribbon domain-containing OB-fold protein [Chloroflexota bacterium]
MTVKRIPINEDFFSTTLDTIEDIRLRGSKCNNCGVAFLGKLIACENCQSTDIEERELGTSGTLYSYTIVWNLPPAHYKGTNNPFMPFAVGMVELSDGEMFLSRLSHLTFDELEIGMPLTLSVEPLYKDEEGNDVMIYTYKPSREEK